MSRLPFFVAPASIVAVLVMMIGSAQAQTARTGGGANAQLLQQMQQLASERTSLQAENAKLKKDLEDTRKERDALKKGQQALEQRSKASESLLKSMREGVTARRESTDQELAQYKEKMQQVIAKFRETAQTLRQVESEGTSAKQTLATRDQELNTCIDRNMALYKLNEEVLTRLEHQGVWGRMARAEPFTQIKRTQLENLVDEYKSRADDQRATPGNLHGSAANPPPPTPAAAVSSGAQSPAPSPPPPTASPSSGTQSPH
jgi:chromosome segregation ATPase